MGRELVPFPQDSPNWALVIALLTELQECLLNETVSAEDTVQHIQVVYEAIQCPHPLDQQWLQCQCRPTGQSAIMQGARRKVDQWYLWFGVLQWLKKSEKEEVEKFLYTTLPNIIELALLVEELQPHTRLCYSHQQKGGTTVLSRQFVASILACGFLCLFPERVKDRASRLCRLNLINFTHFFRQLPLASQVGKLRCILHYFERTMEGGLERSGSIAFHRQVANQSMLPTMEDLTKSDVVLCTLVVQDDGAIESVGSSAMQVDFANCSIGGGVLEKGRAQEEIRFSVCPELIAASLFMENMEPNEAIVITGFEQFSQHSGYMATFQFAGPHHDKAERDASGNLLSTICAIDAVSYKNSGEERQYTEAYLVRDLRKALVGFCRIRHQSVGDRTDQGAGLCLRPVAPNVNHMAEVLSKSLLSQGMVEAVRSDLHRDLDPRSRSLEDVERLDVSLLSSASDTVAVGQSSSTPRDDDGGGGGGSGGHHLPKASRGSLSCHGSSSGSGSSSSGGSNGERLSLPLVVPRGQNGSCDLLEVDYTEWLANFRRRSSQLSDLTSRRSSSSTKHSSEFSTDLEEIYETLVQAEKAEHGVIAEEEHYYGAGLSDYAADFVSMLMVEGTSTAAQMMPGLREFEQGGPPAGTLRPQVVRPSGTASFTGGNGSSDHSALGTFAANLVGGQNFSAGRPLSPASSSTSSGSGKPARRKPVPPPPPPPSQAVLSFVNGLVEEAVASGVIEGASAALELGEEGEDTIPDDVYLWFADKIVQEVFNHVVDELYFQRFTSDSHWRAEAWINREGIMRLDLSDSESLSSSDSLSELLGETPEMSAAASAAGDVDSGFGASSAASSSTAQFSASSSRSESAESTARKLSGGGGGGGTRTASAKSAETTVRKLSADSTVRKLSTDTAVRKLSTDTTVRKLSADTTVRKLSADTTVRKLSGDLRTVPLSGESKQPPRSSSDIQSSRMSPGVRRESLEVPSPSPSPIPIPSPRKGSTDSKASPESKVLPRDSAGTRRLSASSDSHPASRLPVKTARPISVEEAKSKRTVVRQQNVDVPCARRGVEPPASSSRHSVEPSPTARPHAVKQKSEERVSSSSKEKSDSKLKAESRASDLPLRRDSIKQGEKKVEGGDGTGAKQTASPADQSSLKKKTGGVVKKLTRPSDPDGTERKEERKSVTFTVEETRQAWREEREKSAASAQARVRTSKPKIGHLYVVKDVPVPVAKDATSSRSQLESRSGTEVLKSRSAEEVVSSRSQTREVEMAQRTGASGEGTSASRAVERRKSSSASSSSSSSSLSKSFTTPSSSISSIPKPVMSTPSTKPFPSSVVSPRAQTYREPCDTPSPPAAPLPATQDAVSGPRRDSGVPGRKSSRDQGRDEREKRLSSVSDTGQRLSVSQPAGVFSRSPPRYRHRSSSAGDERRLSLPSAPTFHPSPLSRQASEPAGRASGSGEGGEVGGGEHGGASSLSSSSLNLDYYRAAAAIVSQVFQSLPQHLTPEELRSVQRGSGSTFYYQGRKYESVVPRGSYETAAAVMGASEKGNVISEIYLQSKGGGASGGGGVGEGGEKVVTSTASSPRRTRSQSPSLSWLTKRLSRETLTYAFVKVESRHTFKMYQRRSSEPCQRSVDLSNQGRLYGYEGEVEGRAGHMDKDPTMAEAAWRRGSLDSSALSRRRSSCGFKDPILSRFAQELLSCDTSVPQLMLVGSGSTASTTGSRRSSMSGFRDNTLATFETELLNSSFTLSQTTGPGSPRHRRPNRSHSRESHGWKSDSSEADLHWFPIPRRVGYEFQESFEAQQRCYSVEDVHDFADFIANNIIQQAVGILTRDLHTPPSQRDLDIDLFAENLADQVLRDALVACAKSGVGTSGGRTYLTVPRRVHRYSPRSKSSCGSDLDYSVSSMDLSGHSLELADLQDVSDLSVDSLDMYAGGLADSILAQALEDLQASLLRLEPCLRPIATGNWGCGAFRGDPCVKAALQWMAASLAHCPQLLYFTYGDSRVAQMGAVVDMLSRQRWTVGQLMTAVKVYCDIILSELQPVTSHSDLDPTSAAYGGGGDGGGACGGSGEGESFIPSVSLFDFLLMQGRFL